MVAPTRGRDDFRRGIRSFHIRYTRVAERDAHVRNPVHVLYYRVAGPDLIEIVRVLHEHMEPSRHLGESPEQ